MGTVKYTGPVASFHCPTNAEIRSLKVHFSPKQESSGDPSPENVREIVGWDGVEVKQTGKNIGHIIGYSATTLSMPYNTRYTTNSYGTSLNTIEPERSVVITQSQAPETSTKSSYKNGYFAIELDNLIFGKSYDISFKVSNIKSNPLNATLQNLGIGGPSGVRISPTEIRDNLLIYKNIPFARREQNPDQMDFDLRICGMSFTLSDFMIVPANTSDGIYEPYHGATTNYEFGVLGKNKLNPVWESGGINTNTGAAQSGSNNIRLKDKIDVIPGKTYTLSWSSTGKNIFRFSYKKDGSFSRYIGLQSVSGQSFTLNNDEYYFWIYQYNNTVAPENMQLELGSSATAYEPYNPNHTVYGGWVDLITGELMEEGIDNYPYEFISLNGTENWTLVKQNEQTTIFKYNYGIRAKSEGRSICSHFILRLPSFTQLDIPNAFVHGMSGNLFIQTNNTLASTIEEFTNYLQEQYQNNTPVSVLFQANRTNKTYRLPPHSTELKTFISQNNIWSNADYVEVEYDLHETQTLLQRKAFIMANQPHIESASGAIASFKTDLRAPLKECKVYFAPVQGGTGDPSPDNVRAISGWNGLIVGANRAPLPVEYQEVEYIQAQSIYSYFITDYYPNDGTNYYIKIYDGNTKKDDLCPTAFSAGNLFELYKTGYYSWRQVKNDSAYSTASYGVNRNLIEMSSNNRTWKIIPNGNVDLQTYTIPSYNTFQCQTPLILLAREVNGVIQNYKAGDPYVKLYRFTLYENSVTVHDYIPCYRKSDNEPGLYDVITNTFLTKSGEGAFVVGPDVTIGALIPVNWTTEAGTVYGGYVDLITGVLTATFGIKNITSAAIYGTWDSEAGKGAFWYTTGVTLDTVNDGVFCNKLKIQETVSTADTKNCFVWYANGIIRWIELGAMEMTKNEYDAYLAENPLIVTYKLRTPITYQLTPTQLKSLVGANNLWSSADGDIYVKFFKH